MRNLVRAMIAAGLCVALAPAASAQRGHDHDGRGQDRRDRGPGRVWHGDIRLDQLADGMRSGQDLAIVAHEGFPASAAIPSNPRDGADRPILGVVDCYLSPSLNAFKAQPQHMLG